MPWEMRFKPGDKVKCVRSMDSYGYLKGQVYDIVFEPEGFFTDANKSEYVKIVHPDRHSDSWIYANHPNVVDIFQVVKTNTKPRPKYEDWEHA